MSTAVQSTSAPDKESMKTDHSRAVADGAHSHAGPEPAGQRFTSYELADCPGPTGRQEEWRCTPVDRLQKFFAGELTGPAPAVAVDAAPGVRVEQVGRDDERLGTVGAPIDRAGAAAWSSFTERSEEHTSELQSRENL